MSSSVASIADWQKRVAELVPSLSPSQAKVLGLISYGMVLFDGCGMTRIGPAAADISGKRLLAVVFRRIWILIQQTFGSHNHTGYAESALDSTGQHKSLLDQVRILGCAEPLNTDDIGAFQLHNFRNTCKLGLAIYNDGAGTALSLPVA